MYILQESLGITSSGLGSGICASGGTSSGVSVASSGVGARNSSSGGVGSTSASSGVSRGSSSGRISTSSSSGVRVAAGSTAGSRTTGRGRGIVSGLLGSRGRSSRRCIVRRLLCRRRLLGCCRLLGRGVLLAVLLALLSLLSLLALLAALLAGGLLGSGGSGTTLLGATDGLLGSLLGVARNQAMETAGAAGGAEVKGADVEVSGHRRSRNTSRHGKESGHQGEGRDEGDASHLGDYVQRKKRVEGKEKSARLLL
ncbi:hypothetical protein BC828DRAFT_373110 [Blastocladiella britannica]|nr:hypothetical protein BC828DRAFT_373110 [Blastocladiella britannica]